MSKYDLMITSFHADQGRLSKEVIGNSAMWLPGEEHSKIKGHPRPRWSSDKWLESSGNRKKTNMPEAMGWGRRLWKKVKHLSAIKNLWPGSWRIFLQNDFGCKLYFPLILILITSAIILCRWFSKKKKKFKQLLYTLSNSSANPFHLLSE